jgi:hypothetical protein
MFSVAQFGRGFQQELPVGVREWNHVSIAELEKFLETMISIFWKGCASHSVTDGDCCSIRVMLSAVSPKFPLQFVIPAAGCRLPDTSRCWT